MRIGQVIFFCHLHQCTQASSTVHPSGVGKLSTSLMAGVRAERVHLFWVADNTPWQLTLHSSEAICIRALDGFNLSTFNYMLFIFS